MGFHSITVDEALDRDKLISLGIQYGLVYYLDKVKLDRIDNLELDEEEILEARFFSKNKEVHVFRRDGLEASLFIDEGEEYFDDSQLLMKKFGKKIYIRNYINYDEDNQAYIRYSRPIDVLI